jgi:hypothetical protein
MKSLSITLFFTFLVFSCAGKNIIKDEELMEDNEQETEVESALQITTGGEQDKKTSEAIEEEIVVEDDMPENITEYIIEVTEKPAPDDDKILTADDSSLAEETEKTEETALSAKEPETAAQTQIPAAEQRQIPSRLSGQQMPETPPLIDSGSAENLAAADQEPEQEEDDPSVENQQYPVFSGIKDDPPASTWSGVLTPHNEEIIYSRIVRATAGQIVEIPFRGTGWVYLGELASRRGIVYDSRRLDPEGQSFLFRLEEAGTYSLKFFKQDFIRDYLLNDYVQVIAGEALPADGVGWFNPPLDRGRVAAEPRWPSALEEAELRKGNIPALRPAAPPAVSGTDPAKTTSQTQGATSSPEAVSVQPPVSSIVREQPANPQAADTAGQTMPGEDSSAVLIPPDEMVKKAKETFDDGNVPAAIALLDRYREHYPSGTDELYWLYGQLYEANSPNRDILLSLDYYRRLVTEYPQSKWYNDARRRIAYLERFYINIQ